MNREMRIPSLNNQDSIESFWPSFFVAVKTTSASGETTAGAMGAACACPGFEDSFEQFLECCSASQQVPWIHGFGGSLEGFQGS